MLGIFLIIVVVLGLVLIIMGVGLIAAGMISKAIEVKIKTAHMHIAIAVGLLLVIAPFYASTKYFGKVTAVRAVEIDTPQTGKLSEKGSYKVSKEELRFDLHNRKKIGLGGYLAGDLSEIILHVKVIVDVESNVDEVNFRHATSGPGIIPMAKPEDTKWRRILTESEEVVTNPFTSLLTGEKSFKDLIARKGKMRSYYITIPITDKKRQVIEYRLKYHNAFQGADFDWAGKAFSADTDFLSMDIIFPEDKPFTSLMISKKVAPDADQIAIDKPEITTAPDNRTLTWTIRDAKKSEIYYIKWEW